MAKDVDLSSQSWCDIIFEGKNKEFGAYEMRKQSPRRHAVGMFWGIVLAFVFVVGYLSYGYFDRLKMERQAREKALSDAAIEQAMVELEQIEEEEEEEDTYIPPEEEVIEQQEVANEQQVTATLIVEDNEFDKSKQVLDESEKQENEAQFGAQNVTEGTNDLNKQVVKEEVIVEKKEVKEEIFRAVEQMPQFPGGEAELMKWISSHIQYPTMAAEEGAQGRVTVQFVVTKDGSIGEVIVARGRHPALDKEAVRVVKSLPKFIPGKMNGQSVSVWYTLPINFQLQ